MRAPGESWGDMGLVIWKESLRVSFGAIVLTTWNDACLRVYALGFSVEG